MSVNAASAVLPAFGLKCGHQPVALEFHERRDFRRLDVVGACACRLPNESDGVVDVARHVPSRAHLDEAGAECSIA